MNDSAGQAPNAPTQEVKTHDQSVRATRNPMDLERWWSQTNPRDAERMLPHVTEYQAPPR